jgi:quinol monooxygenase YgiN
MFITISTLLVRAGEEDAIIALHEDLQRTQLLKVQGDISGELLRSVENPRQFVAIMHYESQKSAQALANDPEQHAWFQRLVSLTETVPVVNEYKSEWQAP